MFAAAACLLATGAAAATRPTDAEISELVAKYSAAAIADREDIHKNPELSNRETRTGALIAAHLKKLGIEVKTGVAHTGVVGILKGGLPGRTIAVRADIDALPVTEVSDFPFKSTARSTYLGNDVGVSHACGHDVHTAALLGTAAVLASMRDRLPGTVMFIFQPAEEGVPTGEKGGAKLMLEEGIFSTIKPDAVIAFHTNGSPPDEAGDNEKLGTVAYRAGPAFAAATRWIATVHGRQAHGSTPHLGVDPIVTASEIVMSLQTIRSRVLPPLSDNVITVGTFRAGERNNIIPETAELSGTIRTFDDDVARDHRVAHAGHLRRRHESLARDFRPVLRHRPPDAGEQPGADGAARADAHAAGGPRQDPRGSADHRRRGLLVLRERGAGLLLPARRRAGGQGLGRPPHADASTRPTRRCRSRCA